MATVFWWLHGIALNIIYFKVNHVLIFIPKIKERLYVIYLIYLLYYTHIPSNILNKAYYKLVAELVMGRVCHGPSLYGPSW